MGALPVAERLAGQLINFEGADDPLAVVGMNRRAHAGIDLLQAAIQFAEAVRGDLRFEFFAHRSVLSRSFEKSLGQRLQVKPCAAAHDHVLAALMNLRHRRARSAAEQRRVEFFVGIDQVDQMMDDTRSLGGRRLPGADIHVAIHLLGVGIDDLAIDLFRQFERRCALARRRRAENDDELGFHS